MDLGDARSGGSDRSEANVAPSAAARSTSAESDAWERLTTEWAPRLRAYFGRLRCARAERDELVMDVLAGAWATVSAVSQHDGNEAALIRTLAREASARQKRLMRHEVTSADPEAKASADQATVDVAHERMRLWFRLEQLLDRLPDRQRAAIERRLDGVSDAVIAKELGCTQGSVRVLRARGMSALRRIAPPGGWVVGGMNKRAALVGRRTPRPIGPPNNLGLVCRING